MLQRLRENNPDQGALLTIPTLISMIEMLMGPLLNFINIGRQLRTAQCRWRLIYTFSLHNYIRLLGFTNDCPTGIQTCFTSLYLEILWRSLVLGFNTTALDILLAFPLAYFIARAHPGLAEHVMFLVLVPMWTNFVIRVDAWMMSCGPGGDQFLAGMVGQAGSYPVQAARDKLYTPGAVLVGMSMNSCLL